MENTVVRLVSHLKGLYRFVEVMTVRNRYLPLRTIATSVAVWPAASWLNWMKRQVWAKCWVWPSAMNCRWPTWPMARGFQMTCICRAVISWSVAPSACKCRKNPAKKPWLTCSLISITARPSRLAEVNNFCTYIDGLPGIVPVANAQPVMWPPSMQDKVKK